MADWWLTRGLLEKLMFGGGRVRRFTQDSPVLPDVWIEFADTRGTVPLLLTPYGETRTGKIAKALRARLPEERVKKKWTRFGHDPATPSHVVYTQSTIAAELYFEDVIRVVLPMTDWWQKYVGEELLETDWLAAIQNPEQTHRSGDQRVPPELLWMMRVAGAIALAHAGEAFDPADLEREEKEKHDAAWKRILDAAIELVDDFTRADPEARVYAVSLDREAAPSVSLSTLAVKADAARRVFDIRCDKLAWAVIDSGIDARHPAFRLRDPGEKQPPKVDPYETRVRATYDFTELKCLLDPDDGVQIPKPLANRIAAEPSLQKDLDLLYDYIDDGRTLDWALVGNLLRVPHTQELYYPPLHDHGTHVAGILAADWRTAEGSGKEDLRGVCPDLWLYDLRVLKADGTGDEFSVMAALQFVRHLNGTNDYMAVHGANLSLSIPHDVANYACGRTPVCEEAEKVVAAGMVVVAAAGNLGYRKMTIEGVLTELYSSISITDPGNADQVITVGATHRFRPHTYGVSYFSSRGPTGDGRLKPDLVAPGEKINAPILNDGAGVKDGTSMAAPHVSGAAALLMARHNELLGRPARIKQILCSTATDLGRERYFQGAGMLDVLRALQSV